MDKKDGISTRVATGNLFKSGYLILRGEVSGSEPALLLAFTLLSLILKQTSQCLLRGEVFGISK